MDTHHDILDDVGRKFTVPGEDDCVAEQRGQLVRDKRFEGFTLGLLPGDCRPLIELFTVKVGKRTTERWQPSSV